MDELSIDEVAAVLTAMVPRKVMADLLCCLVQNDDGDERLGSRGQCIAEGLFDCLCQQNPLAMADAQTAGSLPPADAAAAREAWLEGSRTSVACEQPAEVDPLSFD